MLIAKWDSKSDEQALYACVEPVQPIERSFIAAFIGDIIHRISRAIVDDVPPELDACEVCRVLKCNQSNFESCEQRLQTQFIRLQNRR